MCSLCKHLKTLVRQWHRFPAIGTVKQLPFILSTQSIAQLAMLDSFKSLMGDSRAQGGSMDLPGVMILLVVAGVVGFVGLQVMSTVITTTSLSSGDPLYNASDSLEQSINSAWGLVGVAFIVVILAVIVVYLYGLRGGR